MTRNLPEDLREKVTNTYKDLVEEDKEYKQKAVREYLKEEGVDIDKLQNDEDVKRAVDDIRKPLHRVEEVD